MNFNIADSVSIRNSRSLTRNNGNDKYHAPVGTVGEVENFINGMVQVCLPFYNSRLGKTLYDTKNFMPGELILVAKQLALEEVAE